MKYYLVFIETFGSYLLLKLKKFFSHCDPHVGDPLFLLEFGFSVTTLFVEKQKNVVTKPDWRDNSSNFWKHSFFVSFCIENERHQHNTTQQWIQLTMQTEEFLQSASCRKAATISAVVVVSQQKHLSKTPATFNINNITVKIEFFRNFQLCDRNFHFSTLQMRKSQPAEKIYRLLFTTQLNTAREEIDSPWLMLPIGKQIWFSSLIVKPSLPCSGFTSENKCLIRFDSWIRRWWNVWWQTVNLKLEKGCSLCVISSNKRTLQKMENFLHGLIKINLSTCQVSKKIFELSWKARRGTSRSSAKAIRQKWQRKGN